MRHLLTIIAGSVLFIAVYMTVYGKGLDFSLSSLSLGDTADKPSKTYIYPVDQIEPEDDAELWIDTIMYAKGHAFGYSGDVSMWGGWYLDTVCVGTDNMLRYDSVGPAMLKLSLVTKELIVDIGDYDVIDRIKDFMNPIDGFMRFSNRYEECLDSLYYEGYGFDEYMGGFSFEVDYADSCLENAEKINRFICDLTGISEIERAKVPGLSAFYAGFKPTKYYRPVYPGNANDMQSLSDFLAHKTFENWKRGGDFGMGSSEATLTVIPRIANKNYVTFSKYEYDRQGIGHGMYTETFYTFDLKHEKELTNNDIFKIQCLENVKMKLFEVMTQDSHYRAWNGDLTSPSEIQGRIIDWQSPDAILEGTEWEEPERDVKFELPDGSLTDSGVVFSFQPYEIDCWAAGAYHFIVPYKKLLPYMTPKARRLIDI